MFRVDLATKPVCILLIFPLHLTFLGQAVKVCPYVDMDEMKTPHLVASRELVSERVKQDLEESREIISTTLTIFTNTYHFITALQRVGCRAEEIVINATPTAMQRHVEQLKRGYRDKEPRCKGIMRCLRDGDDCYVQ